MQRGNKSFQKKIPRSRTTKDQKLHAVQEELFNLKFLKNLEDKVILERRDEYPAFWQAWESYNLKGLKLSELNQDGPAEYAKRSLNSLGKHFYNKPKFIKRREDLKRMREMGAQPIDAINQIVYSETKQETIFDENNNEISSATKTEITAKKIERIEFVSEVTIKSMQNILASQDMADDWIKDYKQAIDSAREGKTYKGKYKFHHLELAAKYNRVALELADKFEEVILFGDDDEIKEANRRMTAANKLHYMMKNVMESEMQVLKTITAFHEGGEARQRELMGAINTDRQLIEMGNAVVTEQKDVVDRTKLRAKLKEQGYSKIQDILAAELKNVGAISDEKEDDFVEADFEEGDDRIKP